MSLDHAFGPRDGLFARLVQALAIGTAVGLLFRMAGKAARSASAATVSLGIADAFIPCFHLPFWGSNVSHSLFAGIAASAAGASALIMIARLIKRAQQGRVE